ncbi:hypothetical protein D3C75_943100 [compost metagenome]
MQDVGLHQFIGGVWAPFGGGEGGSGTPAAPKEAMAQKQITTVDSLLYTATKKITLTELALVTPTTAAEVTVYLKRGGVSYKLFDAAYFDAYLTTIITMQIPLSIGDQIYAGVTNGPSFNITLTGVASGAEQLIALTNVSAGTQTLYTATKGMTITNLVLCNTAGVDTTTTLNIKRSGSTTADAMFLNQLITAAGEAIMGDIETAIDNGTEIIVTTDHPFTLLITAI